MIKGKVNSEIKIEKSSGNVFEDLGLENPSSELLRSEITLEIFKELKKKKLTQAQSAKILGIKQPDISKLKNGDYSHFSLERLFSFLNKLGKSIEVKVSKIKRNKPVQSVVSI